ncbi:MAG: TraR/DksA C4-type zinc finger protein [Kiritimatiellae bacterium]|nr:TraR/DksA C4-type zinc finger protein [Kiritimatiellia bacterium]
MAVFVRDISSKKAPKNAPKKGKVEEDSLETDEVIAEEHEEELQEEDAAKTELIGSVVDAILSPVSNNSYASNIKSAKIEEDSNKSQAFALSIAREMKQRSREEANLPKDDENEIRLSRRPTTRERGHVTEHFPKADLLEFRKRLLDAREKALKGIDSIKSTGFNEADDHEADGGDGTTQTLRLQALGQMGSFNRTIQQIEEALHRIDDGSYGVCTVCGQLIRKPRLVNQPFVLTCMECQNDMEKEKMR